MTTKPTRFFQDDARWKDTSYCGTTMAAAGSAPTIAANLLFTLKNHKALPIELAQFARNYDCTAELTGTKWSFWEKLWNHYGFTGRFIQTQATQTALNCIDEGGLVVCSMEHVDYWRNKPYILLYNYDDTYAYYESAIHDKNEKELMFDFEPMVRAYFCFWPDKVEDDDGEE